MSTILHVNGTIIFKFVQEKDQQPQSLSKSDKQNFTTTQIFNYFGQIQIYGKLTQYGSIHHCNILVLAQAQKCSVILT